MDNVFGWLFCLMSFVVFWALLPKPGRTAAVLFAGFLVLLVHHVLSFVNIIYGPLIFAKYDAWGFHSFAARLAGDTEQLEWAIGTPMYKSLLMVIYDWFGASLWLGQSLSILCFSISAGVLIRLMRLLEVNNMVILGGALLLYGLTPSGLFYGSITLREPWMTMFFVLGSFWAVRGVQKQAGMDVAFACGCWLLMGLFHQVMMIYGFIIAFGLVSVHCFHWWRQQPGSDSGNAVRYPVYLAIFLQVILLLAAGLALFFLLPSSGGDNYFAMIFDSIPESVALYRGAGESSNPTTGYATTFSFVDWPNMILSVLRSYFYYMGWPVTGDYRLLSTPVLMVGGLLRLVGIFSLVLFWRKKVWKGNSDFIGWFVILGLYVSMTFLWNIGTTNHGQALRHHMMTDWILIAVIAVFAQLIWCQRKTQFTNQGVHSKEGRGFPGKEK